MLDIKKLLTTEFTGEIMAMLLKENDYENLKDKPFELVKSDSPDKKCIKIGDIIFNETRDMSKRKNKTLFKYLWNLYVPDCLNERQFTDEVKYVFSTNTQIAEQANWKNENIKFLGNYNNRGGIQKGDIKIILNFMDLYNIYYKDELINEDIYADELLYCLANLKRRIF